MKHPLADRSALLFCSGNARLTGGGWGTLVLGALLVALCGVFRASPASEPAPAQERHTPISSTSRKVDTNGRVETPVETPVPSPKALRYYETGNWVWLARQAWALALPALWLFTGASSALRLFARRFSNNVVITTAVYAAGFVAITALASLPLQYYSSFVRPHAFGLSDQTLGRWAANYVKALGVEMLVASLVLPIPYLLLTRSPRRWWFYTWLLSVPFFCFVMLVKPIWYDPLFHAFGPMRDKALEHDILSLARRAGIEAHCVYEVNMSHDTNTINAYVTGLGQTHRVVLWDTLLKRLDHDQVLFVMAHEMGHFALGHVVRTLLLLSLANLVGFWIVHRASGLIVRRFPSRFGFDCVSDVASVPLFLLLFGALGLAGAPVAMAYSRAQEHEADQFALELTRFNHAGATAFVRMMDENLSNPSPGWFYMTWRATHPSLSERIEFCNEYHPWREGMPMRYARLFRPLGPADIQDTPHQAE
jgi:Zn-dependent protease with chaperone function